ncbi:Uncharacterized protein FKW44_020925 [Caligus rogercresseyi]|uniref:Uncharacterized protein n=1 Tax=Caligus rogercresseyi TaxID=217165 RepID=A0A7T8JVR9_CALRO|nr:Uncharacterized protein FKW44_020925 [Caligus rogercresseyi]
MYYPDRSGSLHSRSQSMPESAYYSRARSRRNIVSMMGPNLRLREPLTVDCSVEYDLGASARVPKGSAPLLIIHPAYVTRSPPPSAAAPSNNHHRCPQQVRSAPPVTRHASFVSRYPHQHSYEETDFRASMPDIRVIPGGMMMTTTTKGRLLPDSGIPSNNSSLSSRESSSLHSSSRSTSSSSSSTGDLNRTIRPDSGFESPLSSSSESGSKKHWRNGVSGRTKDLISVL